MDAAWAASNPMEQAWQQSHPNFNPMEAAWQQGNPMASAWDQAAKEQQLMQEAWEDGEAEQLWNNLAEDQMAEAAWADALAAATMDPTDYPFTPAEENPFMNHPSPFEAGMELFQKGDLQQAILAFEAEVQRHPSNSEAWQLLGTAQAEHDDDMRAILALRKGVEADPHNLDALLQLGVSYTNESNQLQALTHLKQWLEAHPEFQSIDMNLPQTSPGEMQAFLVGLFSQAAAISPQNADVHAVLGVLHNLSRDFDSAILSFEQAVQHKPNDYSLWNKLGATRANSMKAEAAVPAYIQALELKPNYVRALSNLGISYSNQSMHGEAAQCYLRALDLNPQGNHIWSYVTMAFTSMGRMDLVEKARQHNLELLRGEFEF